MLGVGRAAPAQFPAAGREFTRHSARGPEGPLGSVSSNGPKDENIDFNRPFHLIASDISLAASFSFHCKAHRALILLLLASKPDPLSLGSGLGLPVNYSPYS